MSERDTFREVARGRPSLFTPELAEQICERLADGESLRAICRDEQMPNERTVRRWALDNEEFSPQYARAREIGYLGMADDLIEIADESGGDSYTDDDGNERTNHEAVARSRLRVDTRKWVLSKALPKIYGDRSETLNKFQAVDENNQPLALSEAGRLLAFALAAAGAATAGTRGRSSG